MRKASGSCRQHGGCPSDDVAAAFTALSLMVLAGSIIFFIQIRRIPAIRLKQIGLLVFQSAASMIFLSSIIMSRSIIRLNDRKSWRSCYIWQVWMEGPLGFGLLISCYAVRVYRLYFLFVRRYLPPLKSYQLLLLLLLPWCAASAVMQMKMKFHAANCTSAEVFPIILIAILHGLYTIILLAGAWRIRKIEFQFQEFRELRISITVSLIFLGMWTSLAMTYRLLKAKKDWIEIWSRFMLVVVANVFVISFLWISVYKLLLARIGKSQEDADYFGTMGQALKVPHTENLAPQTGNININEPLGSLLKQRRFRRSFLAFADSRMAGEIVHFYEEVHDFRKIPAYDNARRIYMSEHIIETYIKVGSPMEINISDQMRKDILSTDDLANPNLFKEATKEAVFLMEMNLLKDYQQSTFFRQFIEIQGETHFSQPLSESDLWEDAEEMKSYHMRTHTSSDPFYEALQVCFFKEEGSREFVAAAQHKISEEIQIIDD